MEQEKVSEKIIELKKGSYSNEKFLIGYFSGSPSHKRDLEIAESALLKLMNKYDDIYVGYAISFPDSSTARPIEYKVDEVYLRNDFDEDW